MPDRLDDRMVFLVGAPRSGTNWLQRMVTAHPAVVALPSETHLFSHGLRLLDAQVQHGLLTSPSTGTVYLPREEWVAAMRGFCVLVYGRVADSIDPAARLVVERSPHHVTQLDLIGEVFPDARVLHIIRDGRDVARSLARHAWGPRGVAAAAREWRDDVEAARAARERLSRYVEVRYEELLADPRAGVARVFAELGLDADDAVMDAVAAEAGVVFNVDMSSPEVAVGKWRSEWDRRDLAAFDRVAGDTLAALGYPVLPLDGPSPLVRARRLAGAAVRRRRAAPAGKPAVAHDPVVTSLEAVQLAVDGLLADLSAGRVPETAPTVSVRCAGPAGVWTGHGEPARSRLGAALAAEGPWGRQLRGEEEMHGRTVVVTLTHERDGARVDRAVVVGFDRSGTVEHLGYTRFPVAVAGEEER